MNDAIPRHPDEPGRAMAMEQSRLETEQYTCTKQPGCPVPDHLHRVKPKRSQAELDARDRLIGDIFDGMKVVEDANIPQGTFAITVSKPEGTHDPRDEEDQEIAAWMEQHDPVFKARVEAVFHEWMHVLFRKHRDYGPHNIARAPGGALNGLLVRLHDKKARAENLHYTRQGDTPSYESLRDTFGDMANYAIIAMLVLDGYWPGVD